jgi:hypothetical protein
MTNDELIRKKQELEDLKRSTRVSSRGKQVREDKIVALTKEIDEAERVDQKSGEK